MDSGGEIIERYEYSPFGTPAIYSPDFIPRSNSIVDNVYFFGFKRIIKTYNLYENRHRIYHPTLGRFLQRDPLGFIDGFNQYLYTNNNPKNYIDPFGTSFEQDCFFNREAETFVCFVKGIPVFEDPTVYSGGLGPGKSNYPRFRDCINNPECEYVPDTGPIPAGDYIAGEPYDSDKVGKGAIPLIPDAQTRRRIEEYFRNPDDFRAHGDNSRGNQSASQGCIIINNPVRGFIEPGTIIHVR
jgi:RHS repeat-associated protein